MMIKNQVHEGCVEEAKLVQGIKGFKRNSSPVACRYVHSSFCYVGLTFFRHSLRLAQIALSSQFQFQVVVHGDSPTRGDLPEI